MSPMRNPYMGKKKKYCNCCNQTSHLDFMFNLHEQVKMICRDECTYYTYFVN